MSAFPDLPDLVTRREAIVRVSALFGGAALVGQSALLAGCATETTRTARSEGLFTEADIAFLDEVADTILPETSTPGAKAAGTGALMAVMVRDTYDAGEQAIFRDGMQTLEDECLAMHGRGFMACTAEQRLALLERLDAEQFQYMRTRRSGEPAHYFRMMKELALLGYFTSEIGCTEALRYIETPGRFEPCVPYSPGDRAWAAHA